jgi:hypothetical protein
MNVKPKHVEQFPDKINCVTLHLMGYISEYESTYHLICTSVHLMTLLLTVPLMQRPIVGFELLISKAVKESAFAFLQASCKFPFTNQCGYIGRSLHQFLYISELPQSAVNSSHPKTIVTTITMLIHVSQNNGPTITGHPLITHNNAASLKAESKVFCIKLSIQPNG